MKRLALLLLSAVLVTSVHARDLWRIDYQAALEEARQEKKMVLISFTASDWDYKSIQFDKLIASKPRFIQYARKNLVLVEVDFPMRKKQDPSLQRKNLDLLKQYGADHLFPAMILLNAKGEEIARQTEYVAGEVDSVIKWIEAAKKQSELPPAPLQPSVSPAPPASSNPQT